MKKEKNIPKWEKEARERMEKELKDGPYIIDTGSLVMGTGKYGYIKFNIALMRSVRKYTKKLGTGSIN